MSAAFALVQLKKLKDNIKSRVNNFDANTNFFQMKNIGIFLFCLIKTQDHTADG